MARLILRQAASACEVPLALAGADGRGAGAMVAHRIVGVRRSPRRSVLAGLAFFSCIREHCIGVQQYGLILQVRAVPGGRWMTSLADLGPLSAIRRLPCTGLGCSRCWPWPLAAPLVWPGLRRTPAWRSLEGLHRAAKLLGEPAGTQCRIEALDPNCRGLPLNLPPLVATAAFGHEAVPPPDRR